MGHGGGQGQRGFRVSGKWCNEGLQLESEAGSLCFTRETWWSPLGERSEWEGPREVGGWGWTEAQGLIFPHGACGAFSFKVFQLGPPSSSGALILMGAADLEMIILTITKFMAWD